jgi:type II secretory pathway pseudopilin PulG
MAALLTMIAVMSILLSAALPVWKHEIRREKEAELVFRGEQYVHAIGLFQRRYATYPPNIDVLVQQKFLRKKYVDPITGKEFRPVYVGQVAQQQPGSPQNQGAGTQTQQTFASTAAFTRPGQPQPAGVGGLMGVVSTSTDDSIRIYKGRTKYNQWQFVFAGAAARPGGPGGVGRPGMPGPGGRGRGRGLGPGPGTEGEGGGMGRPRGPQGPGGQGQPPPIRQPGGQKPPGGN